MTETIVFVACIASGVALFLAAIAGVRAHHSILAFLVSLGGPWDPDSIRVETLRWISGGIGIALVIAGIVLKSSGLLAG